MDFKTLVHANQSNIKWCRNFPFAFLAKIRMLITELLTAGGTRK